MITFKLNNEDKLKKHKEEKNYDGLNLKSTHVEIELIKDNEIDDIIYILLCARDKLLTKDYLACDSRIDYAAEKLNLLIKNINKEI